jgi:CubicO group peptidase (beta-lactamase class C family)
MTPIRLVLSAGLSVVFLIAAGIPTAQLDQKISATLAAYGAPSVSIAIVKDGALAYAKAFGDANLAEHRSADTSTRYAVGSISKQFTVAAILLSQEQGKLSIDDKVAKYLPDLTRANEVTIRQLLSHTSGYEDFAPQDYMIDEWAKPTTPQAIMDQWAKKPLDFDPGTRWQYSNTNYTIAGKILEKATGQDLMTFLQEHILKPLNMQSASDCDAKSTQDATAYTRFALGPPRPVAREGAGWYFAAGELCMTPSDLAKWDIAFLEKRILSANSYSEFTKEVKLKDGKPTHYALGLQVGEMQGLPTISHGGEVSGFLAANTVFPTKNTGIIVLSNQDGVNMVPTVMREVAATLFAPGNEETTAQDARVRHILEQLAQGKINRAFFTQNANEYFTPAALNDIQTSLAPLGPLKVLTRQSEQLRGGMTHLSYRARFEHDTVALNIYLLPDGKFEQFMIEETF